MQSLSLKTNQQTEKLESVLPEFIPVSEIQSESEYIAGREIAPNTGANATEFFTLATKS